ncbi:MAG: NUDIX hydrolase [Dysosmobacter welbionis]
MTRRNGTGRNCCGGCGRRGALHRDNAAGHLTASAWVVSPDRTQVLMAYHNLYDSWSWLGGHADGDRDLLAVSMREVREESGLTAVRPVSPHIYSLEILTVDGHEKRGAYVSSHLHLNVTYLLEATRRPPCAGSRMRTALWLGSVWRRRWLPRRSPGSGSAFTGSSTPSWRCSPGNRGCNTSAAQGPCASALLAATAVPW